MIDSKKKIFYLLAFLPFGVVGQNYDELSSDIKLKIDQNKQEGLAIYTGIETVYTVTVSNFDPQNQTVLISQLDADAHIKEYTFSLDSGILTVVCNADFPIENVKAYLSNYGAEINHYSQLFRLQP
jgi:hypothetical protein